ncbi:hypothetical protein [Persicitalea sp.]|uniref:hypothetical protein n=1 Tax=Persicitalea sp. TaxID=3100273 RepID=UPI0035935023
MSKNCNPFGKKCEQNTNYTAKEIVFKDKKAAPEFRVLNNSRHFLIKLKVDGCLLGEKIGVRKCDFLLLDCTDNKAFFIELKGQNLGDAIDQIKSTIPQLITKLLGFSFCCRIVQSKVFGARQQRYKRDLTFFLKTTFPDNSTKVNDLVRIESQKIIEQI